MKKQLSLLLLFLLSLTLYPQGEADKWYFPSLTALDFSSGVPVALNDNIGTILWESGTSIADAAGNLLFYSDGFGKIYTKNHTVMANATDMLVNPTMTQGSIFIPKPGSTTIYSFLHLNESGQKISLYYSEIDITQGAGGNVTAIKNVPLATSFEITSEKMAATKHCNGVDYWILVHDATGNAYKAYLLTNAGINPTPVVSNTGTNFGIKAGSSPDALGQMKISPNGTKISTVFGKQDIIELSDFDKSTGIVSNTITLGKTDTPFPYGTEFSSDNTKVYASGGGASGTLKQWDLCAGSGAAIISSETLISMSTANGFGMQLAPDNKIYLRVSGLTQSVVNNPNNAGVACNFSNMGPVLIPSSGSGAGYTFPNFASNFIYDPVIYSLTPSQTDASNCQGNGSATVTVNEAICSAALYTYSWSNGIVVGPTGTLTNTISNLAPGNYKVIVSSSDACYIYEDSLSFTISDLTTAIPPDTQNITICAGENFTLPDGEVVSVSGIYKDTITAVDGCDSIVTTDLKVSPATTTTLNPSICSGENYTLPNGNEVNENGTYTNIITSTTGCDSTVIVNLTVGEVTTTVNPSICEGEVYSLSNGNAIGETGTYADTLVAAGGCDSIVTIHLTVNPNPTISLGDDVTIEFGQSTSLTSNGTDGTHEWSPSETLDCVTCSTTLATPLETTTYTVTVTDGNGCVASKSITVEVLNDISKNNNALYIPNAFTPNEDNTNPTFRPIGDLITENKYLFTIYDRWGQPIFLSQNPLDGWDGSFEGEVVPLDVYAWTLEFNDPQGKSHKLSGKVTVLE